MQNAFVLQVLDSDACPLYVCARVDYVVNIVSNVQL